MGEAQGAWNADEAPSGVRLTDEIDRQLKEELAAGRWPPGMWLDSEPARLHLAARFAAVSDETVWTQGGRLVSRARIVSVRAILRDLGEDSQLSAVPSMLVLLEGAGLVERAGRMGYALTPEGYSSTWRAMAPRPASVPWRRWAGQVAHAIAARAEVSVHDMLHSDSAPWRAVFDARARLCAGVAPRGGAVPASVAAIHFGMKIEAFEDARDRWAQVSHRLHDEAFTAFRAQRFARSALSVV